MSDDADATCNHLHGVPEAGDLLGLPPSGDGCIDCLAIGGHWVHLRRCLACGHVGCCDSSPNKHATAHAVGDRASAHPVVRAG